MKPVGSVTTRQMTVEQAMSGSMRNILICWSSCSELVMAPSAAAMLE